MPRIAHIDLLELDVPFRHAFRHAAAERVRSESLLVRFVTDDDHVGWGEALPRRYVTGETRESAFALLAQRILPRVLGMSFASFDDVHAFLLGCDGKAPPTWVDPGVAQTAAWCAVDLALLDAFGRAFRIDLGRGLPGGAASGSWPEDLRYGVVLSDDPGPRRLLTLLKARLYGIRDVKVKVCGPSPSGVRLARRVLGARTRLRVDSNMAWNYGAARRATALTRRYDVAAFEQPLPADDLEGLARLTTDGVSVVADESIHDAASLERLIATHACTGVNVRIAKCGGLVASVARCRRARDAGLTLQIGCQVGETSLLSAAQLSLVRTVGHGISYLEGCYGERLLAVDPVRPVLQFGRGGRPPRAPAGWGFGTEVDRRVVELYGGRRMSFGTVNREELR